MERIAIFASGSGSNAQRIMEHFAGSDLARVALVLTNNPEARVIERARAAGIEALVFDRARWDDDTFILGALREREVSYVVLSGFLWLVPPRLVEAFEGRMVNIHPSLLPKYGGLGMYGGRVHRAVIEAGERESGITVHLVDGHYDRGSVLAQFRVAVSPDDDPEGLAEKIHALEHAHFPSVIEQHIKTLR